MTGRIITHSLEKESSLRRADHSTKMSYRLCKINYGTEEEARAQKRAVDTLTNERNVCIEVFIAVILKSSVFWDIRPCSPLKFVRSLGRTCQPIFKVEE
jgi:hypothetical protein